MKTETFAQKIADFVRHNKIDLTKVSLDQVVEGYMKAQDKMYERIQTDLETALK